MKVDHFSFSRAGGAGIVAQSLVSEQQKLGANSFLHTLIDSNLTSEPLRRPLHTFAAAVDLGIVANGSSKTLFSFYRRGLASGQLYMQGSDSIAHLHWVEGVLGAREFESLLDSNRRVIWTLHDMAPFTGGCHHSHSCNEYNSACSSCPQVRPFFRSGVEKSLTQSGLLGRRPNLTLVAPTEWLKDKARLSSRFREQDIRVIPNPISRDFFGELSKPESRAKFQIDQESLVFIAIASDLSNPSKKIAELVEAFSKTEYPAKSRRKILILVGLNGKKFHNPGADVLWMGSLTTSELAAVASSADWVLSMSSAESAGMTLAECGALGVPSLSLDVGGVGEMFVPGKSGILANSQVEFLNGLNLIVAGEVERDKYSQEAKVHARRKFDPERVTLEYLKLYADH